MVHPVTTDSIRFTGHPDLVVEVLSTNRNDDLVTKTTKYAAAGVRHYWIVDPRSRTVDAYTLTSDSVYAPVAHLAEGQRADMLVDTNGPGPVTVQLDLVDLFRD